MNIGRFWRNSFEGFKALRLGVGAFHFEGVRCVCLCVGIQRQNIMVLHHFSRWKLGGEFAMESPGWLFPKMGYQLKPVVSQLGVFCRVSHFRKAPYLWISGFVQSPKNCSFRSGKPMNLTIIR